MTTNFGALPVLRVSDKNQSLLRFDTSSIPSFALIDSAAIELYVTSSGSTGAPINVHRATVPWSEQTVTFASFAEHFDPAVAGAITVAAGEQGQRSIGVKDLVAAWVSHAQENDGVLVEKNAAGPTVLVSREGGTAAQKPVLRVCYELPPDHCTPQPCANGGTCENGWTGYTCHCAPGFTGTDCETNIDDCAAAPCQNGGTCVDGVDSYSCTCAAGFTGANCETNIDECAQAPCQNGGVCEDGIAAYTCHCVPGYEGTNCETLIDNCESAPCQNGGSCTNAVNAYSCACVPGFSGTNCEINIDDCAAQPCHNGGTCVDGVNAYTCVCPPDWGGSTCDVNLNSCSQHPCLNNATCTNTFGGYVCGCAPGFTGTNCEININECEGVTCQNDGVCVDGIAQFTCTCKPGSSGTYCGTSSSSWLQLSAGAGVATVVWGDVPNATSYSATSDHPDQQQSGASCANGVCALQLAASDGDSAIAVTASNSLATVAVGNGTTTATAGAPAPPRYAGAYSHQYSGVVTTSFSWQGVAGNYLSIRELDPSTGTLTTRSMSYISTYDPFCYYCYEPPTYCSTFGCTANVTSLTPGTHIYQLEIIDPMGTLLTARSLPIVTTVPSLDTTPPPSPTNLRIVSVDATTATLAWDRSPASDVASYTLKATTPYWTQTAYVGASSCDATTCRGTIASLYPGLLIDFTVHATDVANNVSPESGVVEAVLGSSGPLTAPTLVSVTPDDNMLEVRFTAVWTSTERAGRYHVWYQPTAGGPELDAGILSGFCESHCQVWIQGLSAIPYSVQVQSEGSPGNFSPRSAAMVATPAPRAPASVETTGCYNNNLNRVKVFIEPTWDPTWIRLPFAPDVAGFRIQIHALFDVLVNGVWWGDWYYQDFYTDVSRSVACPTTSPNNCVAIVNVPGNPANASLSVSQTGVSAVAYDTAGNILPFTYSLSIGYPGTVGTLCQNGNF